MALYHFHVTQLKRSAGQSAVAAAAYRAGEKLYCDYYGKTHDYTRKHGVVHTEIMLPENAPEAYHDRATLWNAVEVVEKNDRAQLAYNFDIALQNELTMEENIELARAFVQQEFVDRGMIADLCVHMPEGVGGNANPHFHVLCPMRPINPDGSFGAKQRREYALDANGNRIRNAKGDYVFNAVHTTDWHTPERLESWRKVWADMVNARLEEKQSPERINHRSYEQQGIDLVPTAHEGIAVRKMEEHGIRTEKGEINRRIRFFNRMIRTLKEKISQFYEWLKEYRDKANEPNLYELLGHYYDSRYADAYSRKGKTKSLKEYTETICFMEEHNLVTISDLESMLDSISATTSDLNGQIEKISARQKELEELIRYGNMYLQNKPVYEQLTSIRWKKPHEKFKEQHAEELRLFYLAKRKLTEKLGSTKVTVSAWQDEINQCERARNALYDEYRPQHELLMQICKIKSHINNMQRSLTSQIEKTHQHDRT